MKIQNLSLSIIIFILLRLSSSIYDLSVPTIEGSNQPISSFQGRKILFIVLPTEINSSGDSLLISLDSLDDANSSTLTVVGTPSFEDGYSITNKETLRQWYRSYLDSSVIITDGLYTHKNSAATQHALYYWLTDKHENDHFDQEVEGVGQKFLVTADGRLSAVLGPQIKIGGATMRKLIANEQ